MGSAPMRFGGFIPEDAPDPRIAQAERLQLMPVPVMGFVAQPTLEDVHMESTMSSGMTDLSEMTVGITYTLWRNPDDRSDPANLAVLDDAISRALDGPFPVPRPAWLIEQVERMRYPILWEAVRTTWHSDQSELSSGTRILVEHTNYILMNRFRKELGLGDIVADRFAARVTERAVNSLTTVTVDGIEIPAFEIDTDPFVYAIGAEINAGYVVTAVVPRADLEYVQIGFARRASRRSR
ncbi:hypothetical protein [Leifsonia poae]|uniref:hypothetical protein n=1 Tax=Leifsonia poae TaxID=110933 RepID=UPI003D67A187